MDASNDISALLVAWKEGDEDALKRLVSVVYPEMRKIARLHLARRPENRILESAALANEAYLRLIRAKGIECKDRAHFFAVCAQIIRRILVDHARNQRRIKRGGGAVEISLDEALLPAQMNGVDVLALDEALASLLKIDERKCRVVELRFFGGLSVEESAEVLEVSPETVMRDWKMAKAWLFRELTGGQGVRAFDGREKT
jgi:RNA polymerase sigma-70 factor, ECF subfamily